MPLELASASYQVAVAIVPKVTAVISFCTSFWIINEVLYDEDSQGKRKRESVYNRLLFGMSSYDFVYSIWMFMSSWPILKGTPNVFQPIGNQALCDAQGFILQWAGVGPSMYNAYLGLYYLLVIRYGMSEKVLRRWVEPSMHISTFIFSFGTAIVGLVLNLYNNATLWCWIAPYPNNCTVGRCVGDNNAWVYRWAFYFAPVWTCIVVACVCMYLVYRTVREQFTATLKYRRPELNFMEGINARERSLNDDPYFEPSHEEIFACQKKRFVSFSFFSLDSSSLRSNHFKAFRGRIFKNNRLTTGSTNNAARNDRNLIQLTQLPVTHDHDNLSTSSSPDINASVECFDVARGDNNENSRQFNSIKNSNIQFQQQAQRKLQLTHDVYVQACWYLAAFLINHLFQTINRVLQQFTGNTYFMVTVLHSFFNPLQGAMNFLVYRRPRYMAFRRLGETRLKSIRLALLWSRKSSKVARQLFASGSENGVENNNSMSLEFVVNRVYERICRRKLRLLKVERSLSNDEMVNGERHSNAEGNVERSKNSDQCDSDDCNDTTCAINKSDDGNISDLSNESKQEECISIEEETDGSLSVLDNLHIRASLVRIEASGNHLLTQSNELILVAERTNEVLAIQPQFSDIERGNYSSSESVEEKEHCCNELISVDNRLQIHSPEIPVLFANEEICNIESELETASQFVSERLCV